MAFLSTRLIRSFRWKFSYLKEFCSFCTQRITIGCWEPTQTTVYRGRIMSQSGSAVQPTWNWWYHMMSYLFKECLQCTVVAKIKCVHRRSETARLRVQKGSAHSSSDTILSSTREVHIEWYQRKNFYILANLIRRWPDRQWTWNLQKLNAGGDRLLLCRISKICLWNCMKQYDCVCVLYCIHRCTSGFQLLNMVSHAHGPYCFSLMFLRCNCYELSPNRHTIQHLAFPWHVQ